MLNTSIHAAIFGPQRTKDAIFKVILNTMRPKATLCHLQSFPKLLPTSETVNSHRHESADLATASGRMKQSSS